MVVCIFTHSGGGTRCVGGDFHVERKKFFYIDGISQSSKTSHRKHF